MRSFQVLDTVTRKNPVILRSQSYPCLKTLLCATWVIRIKLPKETVWTGNSFKIRSLLTLHIVLRHCFKGISNYSINSLLTGLWDNTASESHISASTAKSVTVPEFLLFKVTEFLKTEETENELNYTINCCGLHCRGSLREACSRLSMCLQWDSRGARPPPPPPPPRYLSL